MKHLLILAAMVLIILAIGNLFQPSELLSVPLLAGGAVSAVVIIYLLLSKKTRVSG